MKYKIIIANVVFVLAMFPYVLFFHTHFDLQPWAIIFASLFSIFLFYEDKFSLPTPLKILALFIFYAFISFVYLMLKGSASIFYGAESLAGYLSILVFAFVGYRTFSYLKTEYYFGAIEVWLMAAFSQLLFGAAVLSPLLSRVSTGGVRGLTSLASEPAFYATICISLLVLNEFFYFNKKYGIKAYSVVFLVLLLQIILSYSGIGMMLLLLFAMAKLLELLFIKEEKIKKWLTLGSMIFIILTVFLFF